ncbi:hypothetical protein [Iamia sp.]|uniref:hypothetical protein n=1 Tax=Iamia sp. TaxID=2722710 RepID=UPI002B62F62D|nr:hypothetical protein [Iamia sp.]HXH56330.1 hypothetical protein [Iamia sp.]
MDFDYFFDDDGVSEGSSEGYEEGCWGIETVAEGQGGTWEEAAAEQASQGENGVAWGKLRPGGDDRSGGAHPDHLGAHRHPAPAHAARG